MLVLAIFAAQILPLLGAAVFAYATGGSGERRAAIWWGGNYIVTTIVVAAGWGSPTVQLVLDGICATGFLPLAIFYVSWWAGAVALLSAALFGLEAAYLLSDQKVDLLYMQVNNLITLATGLVFLVCGAANLHARRRYARSLAKGAALAA
jgi:hypothetical protein